MAKTRALKWYVYAMSTRTVEKRLPREFVDTTVKVAKQEVTERVNLSSFKPLPWRTKHINTKAEAEAIRNSFEKWQPTWQWYIEQK